MYIIIYYYVFCVQTKSYVHKKYVSHALEHLINHSELMCLDTISVRDWFVTD